MASWKGFREWLRLMFTAASVVVIILVAGELLRGKDLRWFWFPIVFIAAEIVLAGVERWLKRIIREVLREEQKDAPNN